MKQRVRIQRRRAPAFVAIGLLVGGVIAGCSLGLADLDSSSGRMTVSDLDLTGHIPSPVAGATPVTELQGKQYTGSITWQGGAFPFEQKALYTATVTLQTRPGYDFTGNEVFSHGGAIEVSPGVILGDGKVRLTLRFPETLKYLRFSNFLTDPDKSVIDLIRATAGQPSVTIELSQHEEVKFDSDTDLGTTGLVLDSTNSPPKVIIYGHGKVIDLVGRPNKVPLITVGNGVSLTLRNITFRGLSGNGGEEKNNAPLILVKNGGTLIMEDGAVIEQNYNDYTDKDPDFFGGGVSLSHDETAPPPAFTLRNATIRKNYARLGGGVHAYGNFTMGDGGEISYNTAQGSGGGVCVNEGRFTMTGGIISCNTAGGDSSYNASIEGIDEVNDFQGQNICFQRNGGGGVYVLGTFIMTGGTISGNEAFPNSIADSYGGGVLILGRYYARPAFSTFKKTGGAIKGNTGAYGSQVYAAAIALLLDLDSSLRAFVTTYAPPFLDGALEINPAIDPTAYYYEARCNSPAGPGDNLTYMVSDTTPPVNFSGFE
jgi:hypothetical protein